MVARCNRCNAIVIDSAKFCPECGKEILTPIKVDADTGDSGSGDNPTALGHATTLPPPLKLFLGSKTILYGAIASGISWLACWLIISMFGIDKEMGFGVTTYANSLSGTMVIADSGILHVSNLTFLFLTLVVITIVSHVYITNEIRVFNSFALTLKKCVLMVPWFAIASFAIATIAKSKNAYVPPLHVVPGALIVGTIGVCAGTTISHIQDGGKKMLELWTEHEDKRITAGLLGLLAVACEMATFMAVVVLIGIILMCYIGKGAGTLFTIGFMTVGNLAANIGTYAHGVSMSAQGELFDFGGEAASISLWSWNFLGETSNKIVAWHILSWISALVVLLTTAHTAVMLEKAIREIPTRTKSQCCLVFGGVYGILWGYIGWLAQIGFSDNIGSAGFGASASALGFIAGGLAFMLVHLAIYIQRERGYTQGEANATLFAVIVVSVVVIMLLTVAFYGSSDENMASKTESSMSSLFGIEEDEEAIPSIPMQTNQFLEALSELSNEKKAEAEDEIGFVEDDTTDNRYSAPDPNSDQSGEDDYATTEQDEFRQPQSATTRRDPPPAPPQYSTPSREPDQPSSARRDTTPTRSTPRKSDTVNISSGESVVASNLDPTEKFSRGQLASLPNEILCLLRNEYYAREGCYLETPHVDEFFRQFSWYKSQEKGGKKATEFRIENFSSTIRANILLIKQIEKERGSWHVAHKESLPGIDDLAGWAHGNDLLVYNEDNKISPYYQWSMEMKSASSTNTYQCVMVLNEIDFNSGAVSGTVWQKNKAGEVAAEDVEGTLASDDSIHIRHLNLEGTGFYPQLKGWFLDKFVIDIGDDCQIHGSYFVKSSGQRAGSITGCLMEDD